MTDVIVGGEHLKPETAEVLKELEAEGHALEGITPKEQPKDQPKVEEPQKPAEETKPQADPKKEQPEAKAEDKTKVQRKVESVPFQKFDAIRHELAEEREARKALEAKIQELSDKPQTAKNASDIKELMGQLAELESEEAKLAAIVEFARKGVKPELPSEVAEKLKVLDKYQELSTKAEEEQAFAADFDKVSKDLSEQGIDITGHKDALKQLAYTEGYTSTSLRAIALEYAHDNGLLKTGRKTLEKGSAGRTVSTEAIDFDSLSEEQAKALPDDQWEKYVEHQIVKQRRAQGIQN